MKEAIEKLKQLAEDNTKFADQLAEGETIWHGADKISQERVDDLVRAYRYCSNCLNMAAWLLENAWGMSDETKQSCRKHN